MTTPKEHRIVLLNRQDRELEAMQKQFVKAGHKVKLLNLTPEKSDEEAWKEIDSFKPSFCFFRNFYPYDISDPRARSLRVRLEKAGIPVVAWFVDNPRGSGSMLQQDEWEFGELPGNLFCFHVDTTHGNFFEERGIAHAHLPIGVDEDLESFRPTPEVAKRFAQNLSFVGRPPAKRERYITDAEVLNGALGSTLRNLKSSLLWQLPLRESTKDLVNRVDDVLRGLLPGLQTIYQIGSTSAGEFKTIMDNFFVAIKKGFPEDLYRVVLSNRGFMEWTYSWCALIRQLRHLESEEIYIRGGDNWKNYVKSPSSDYRHLTQEELLNSFYATKVNFCFTKMLFGTVVHERPLLVLATGGFPLTDDLAEVHEFFGHGEIALYSGMDDARDKARYYLKNDSLREKMIKKGRERVFKSHTYEQRVKSMIQTINEKVSFC